MIFAVDLFGSFWNPFGFLSIPLDPCGLIGTKQRREEKGRGERQQHGIAQSLADQFGGCS